MTNYLGCFLVGHSDESVALLLASGSPINPTEDAYTLPPAGTVLRPHRKLSKVDALLVVAHSGGHPVAVPLTRGGTAKPSVKVALESGGFERMAPRPVAIAVDQLDTEHRLGHVEQYEMNRLRGAWAGVGPEEASCDLLDQLELLAVE